MPADNDASPAPGAPPLDRQLIALNMIRSLTFSIDALLDDEADDGSWREPDEVAAADRLLTITNVARLIAELVSPADPRDVERLLRDEVSDDEQVRS
jgi:hypothetical protein